MSKLRLVITLGGPDQVTLPVHHNHLLQAAVYRLIEHPALSAFLHEQGFMLGQRKFKLFTFSRLLGKARLDRQNKLMQFQTPLKLVLCSPVQYLLQELGQGLLRRDAVRLGEASLYVQSVAVSEPVVKANTIKVRMLSPVVAYSTIVRGTRKYTYYYSPFEERFAELLGANLAKKYVLVYGQPVAKERFACVPVALKAGDFKVLKYKDTVIKGWMGTYTLEGDPDLLKLALTAGLGAKGSQGFGCCILEEEEI